MNENQTYLQLYQTASKASTLPELIEYAHQLSGFPILIADSIHNIIDASSDIIAEFGPAADWNLLVSHYFLPAPPDAEEQRYQMPFALQVKQSPPIHMSRCPLPDDKVTFLCDLRDQGHIVLKLAVMRTMGHEQDAAFVQVLAESCYMLYFRLIAAGGHEVSGRGRYLHTLICGKSQVAPVDTQWLNIQPPYMLLVFPTTQGGVVALSFSEMSTVLEQAMGYGIRTVSDTEQMVILLHCSREPDRSFDAVNHILRQFHQPAGVSGPFSELHQAAAAYHDAAKNLETAMDFQQFYRLATHEEFSVFRMFGLIAKEATAATLLHPDAKKLEQMDITHSLHYMETVFAWLYYEKNATAAARHIFIHRNTLDNRIRKITTLLDAHWEQGGYCISMLYSTWFLLRAHGWLRDCLLYLPEPDANSSQT